MKKSIIALVIAGLPLAASAEVILYGQIKSSVTVGQVKIKGDAGSETSSTATSINDNTSRIGFKGSENRRFTRFCQSRFLHRFAR